MKKLFTISLISLFSIISFGQKNQRSLQVTPNGHFLQYADGTPFFWLGDTAWELFHRLTLEEIEQYLDNRQAKGFNVIQAVILAEIDGLRTPNKYGDVPLIDMNLDKPNEAYFKLVDTVIKMAAERNLIIALLPTWGDKVTLKYGGLGPVIFNTENAYRYGKFLGNRYKNKNNIVWIMGGDRPAQDDKDDWKAIYKAMAKGIEGGQGKHTLKSFHPGGYIWESAPMLHQEPWLDFNMNQSGHTIKDQPIWKTIARDWDLQPTKPTLDSEPCYEDHPLDPWRGWTSEKGYFRDYDVRKQLYRSVFAGAMGVTYGHHAIWQFYNPSVKVINYADRYCDEALDRPAAYQSGNLKNLILSRPSLDRIPEQSLIISGQGDNNAEHVTAFRDAKATYAMVYLPVGKEVEINTEWLKARKIKAWWFNPANNEATLIGIFKREKKITVTPPHTGIGHDWVLVLDDTRKKYGTPGKMTITKK